MALGLLLTLVLREFALSGVAGMVARGEAVAVPAADEDRRAPVA